MAETLQAPITQTLVVDKVQITRFQIDYEEGIMQVDYLTLLNDGTPYQRGTVQLRDAADISQVYIDTEALMTAGDSLEVAAAKVAYGRVMESL